MASKMKYAGVSASSIWDPDICWKGRETDAGDARGRGDTSAAMGAERRDDICVIEEMFHHLYRHRPLFKREHVLMRLPLPLLMQVIRGSILFGCFEV